MANSRLAALALCALVAGCSSAPKRNLDAVAVKNEAGDYAKLADDYLRKGQAGTALQYYLKALEMGLSVDDAEGAALARGSLGRAFLALGRLEDAERELTDAELDAMAVGAKAPQAFALSGLAELRAAQGRNEEAAALLERAAGIAPAGSAVAALVAHNRGAVALAVGKVDEAEAFLKGSAALNEAAGRWAELGSDRYVLAAAASKRGDTAAAMDWARKALEADKKAENSLGIGADLEALARLAKKIGDLEGSRGYYRRALGLWIAMGRETEAVRCARSLAEVYAALGDDVQAERYRNLADGSGSKKGDGED